MLVGQGLPPALWPSWRGGEAVWWVSPVSPGRLPHSSCRWGTLSWGESAFWISSNMNFTCIS